MSFLAAVSVFNHQLKLLDIYYTPEQLMILYQTLPSLITDVDVSEDAETR